jgi:hypothetical protein
MAIQRISPVIEPNIGSISIEEIQRAVPGAPYSQSLLERAQALGLDVVVMHPPRHSRIRLDDLPKLPLNESAVRKLIRDHKPRTVGLHEAAKILGLPFHFESFTLAERRGVLVDRNVVHIQADADGLVYLSKLLAKEREIDNRHRVTDGDMANDWIPIDDCLPALRANQTTPDSFVDKSYQRFSPDVEFYTRASWLQIRYAKAASPRMALKRMLWSGRGMAASGFDLYRLAGVKCANSDMDTYEYIMQCAREEVEAEQSKASPSVALAGVR